jgi:predicted RND superfamily exporter protein
MSTLIVSGGLAFLLYASIDFIIPIRIGGIFGLSVGMIFSWTLYFSLRNRFPRIEKVGDEVKVLRAKNPLPQLIAARVSVVALSITRASALVLGFYVGICLWALTRGAVDYIQDIALLAAIGALLSFAILISGVFLERLCSPPSGDALSKSEQTT